MKIMIYSDVHWSVNSSLVRSRGTEFSTRLELLIKGMNWVNKLAIENGCGAMVCAGDFMDKAQLTDEELTALQRIEWNGLPQALLCGNHESSVSDLRYSSLKAIESRDRVIVDRPLVTIGADCDIVYLPYILESDRKPLIEYIRDLEASAKANLTKREKPLVIISHNDIAGINYGGFESKSGFSIDEIGACCDLYLNGHLHNSEWITKKILNVGSMTAHNFTNDSLRYKYGVWILDTSNLSIDFYENPYGLNFYKFEVASAQDVKKLNGIKGNAVVSVKCPDFLLPEVKKALSDNAGKLIDSRVTLVKAGAAGADEVTIAELQSDHLGKFVEFCKANISNTEVLEAELAEVCK